jgi:heme o synthase
MGFETQTLLENGWREVRIEYNKLLSNYAKLSKRNLTGLVVATTIMGCVMAPVPLNAYILGLTTLGTTLTSASANAYNQFLEVPYDSQMNRTKDRVLVRGDLTPLHAFMFATVSGILGLSILFFCVNPLTAGLGLSTLLLYTLIYTPIKRLSALNTWIGSVVGAIPPLMGYTAMIGEIEPGNLNKFIIYDLFYLIILR